MTGSAFILAFVLWNQTNTVLVTGYNSFAECEKARAHIVTISRAAVCFPAPVDNPDAR